jgi:hypothetical protein
MTENLPFEVGFFCGFFWGRAKKKAASTSCLKAMKTIKQCSENRKLETIISS